MIGMKRYPDKFFDLAIVDPPYGLGSRLIDGGKKGGMGSLRNLADDKVERWDTPPDKEYFDQLFRVSKKQIIWGGNYFLDHLGATDGFLIWDKMNGTNPMSDAELAWKSFGGTTRMFRMHHFSAGYDDKIHPTQKPVKLYKWVLNNYATCKKCHNTGTIQEVIAEKWMGSVAVDCEYCDVAVDGNLKILDTHLGSQSSRIAAYDLGFDFYGWELDKDYYEAGNKRFEQFKSQGKLF